MAGLGAVIAALAIMLVAATIIALPIKWAWNWCMPDLFGFKTISFAQAWCLMFLGSALTGGSSRTSSTTEKKR